VLKKVSVNGKRLSFSPFPLWESFSAKYTIEINQTMIEISIIAINNGKQEKKETSPVRKKNLFP
jgi:hypothetical protein